MQPWDATDTLIRRGACEVVSSRDVQSVSRSWCFTEDIVAWVWNREAGSAISNVGVDGDGHG